MIFRLDPSQYSSIHAVFRPLAKTQPMCTAVLEGVYPGKIFVDDPDKPRSPFLTTHIGSETSGTWGFLAGNPTNDDFNRALNTAIFEYQLIHPESSILL